MGTSSFSLGIKRPERGADHVLEVQTLTVGGGTCPFPLYAFVTWTGKVLPFSADAAILLRSR